MFLVGRANTVNYPLGLEHIFLVQGLLRFLAAGIGARHSAGETPPAWERIHLEKPSGLIRLPILGQGGGRHR
jgi:hypothetical protein